MSADIPNTGSVSDLDTIITDLKDQIETEKADDPEGYLLPELEADLKSVEEFRESITSYGSKDAYFVAEDEFETHAKSEAECMGNFVDLDWPFRHIDWAAAASELKQDYTCITFEGTDYWVRTT